ncbi:hypothetical protein BLNAU_10788 [Blattamonas nauphoetae]|uniref:Uncharacterized protein n=1 Tax=Blattamonas nauphoetae TaxID=2049346 RepID=A0ABQ9XR41_9EUKA|nr:hypothetical protein BLNAU_10788 [Blattamonas nauphoetae]
MIHLLNSVIAVAVDTCDFGDTDSEESKSYAVRKTFCDRIIAPSSDYIHHLFVIRYSIDPTLVSSLLQLLVDIICISPYHIETAQQVGHMPVFVFIPSLFDSLERDVELSSLLFRLNMMISKWDLDRRALVKGQPLLLRLVEDGLDDMLEMRVAFIKLNSPLASLQHSVQTALCNKGGNL